MILLLTNGDNQFIIRGVIEWKWGQLIIFHAVIKYLSDLQQSVTVINTVNVWTITSVIKIIFKNKFDCNCAGYLTMTIVKHISEKLNYKFSTFWTQRRNELKRDIFYKQIGFYY